MNHHRDKYGFCTNKVPFTDGPLVYLGQAETELSNFVAIGPKGQPATAYCVVWTDARLYAASIDLLTALKAAKHELGNYLACGGTPPTTQRAYDAAERAILRAEGGP